MDDGSIVPNAAGRIHMIFKNREDFVVELCYGEDYDGTIRR